MDKSISPVSYTHLDVYKRQDHMEVVVVYILPQRLRHSPVALVSVHDRRQDVLFAAHDFDCSLIRCV